jgi:Uma2 family endonuclease
MHDLRTKASAYQQHGVAEYWVVDGERKIVMRHLLGADPRGPYQVHEYAQGRLESQAILGFWLDVSWLWEDPLPDELACLSRILAP